MTENNDVEALEPRLRMQALMLQLDLLHADETTIQVLAEPGKAAEAKSYMWLYRSGRDVSPIVLYDYQTSRHSKHPKAFLNGFSGYLHVDGYAGYHDVKDAELVGCWTHARRKYDEALKSLPADIDKSSTLAAEGLQFCNQLFNIEKEIDKNWTTALLNKGRNNVKNAVNPCWMLI